jgi:hypothetical protein
MQICFRAQQKKIKKSCIYVLMIVKKMNAEIFCFYWYFLNFEINLVLKNE